MALLVTAWIGFARHLVGTDDGAISLIWLGTLGAIQLIVALIALSVPATRGVVISGRAVAWLWFSYAWGTVLGLFLPDPSSAGTAVVTVLFGDHWQGAESAISNPAAIIMIVSAVFSAVFAILDSRPGGPRRTDAEDHVQGSGFYPLLGDH